MSTPSAKTLAELVRLPAVLTAPGDVLAGAAASGQGGRIGRNIGLSASSACLYLAGMALNDYADRDIDAHERPGRPIPSGRVSPQFALGLAGGLTAAGAIAAVIADGPRALKVNIPLAGAVWAYDLALKGGPLGPASMSACRALDVLQGSGAHGAVQALPAAVVVGAHTATVTAVSHHEVEGGAPQVSRKAAIATAGVSLAAAGLIAGRSRSLAGTAAGAALVGAYGALVGGAYMRAASDPSPATTRRAVGTGILGVIPLESGIVAGAGRVLTGIALSGAWPLARHLARRRAVT